MTFQDIPYQRPRIEEAEKQMASFQEAFRAAKTFDAQWEIMAEANRLRSHLFTMMILVNIRHSVNTLDPFYEAENAFFDEINPRLKALNMSFYDMLLGSPFLAEFESKLGKHFFDVVRLSRKTFSPEIMEELAQESKLTTQYQKLLAAAQIDFEGEKRTLSAMQPFFESPDRAKRKAAMEAYWGYFEEHAETFDAIYDQLVALRDSMAKKLGYENFVQMGYDRMGRSDYGPEDVAIYREGIRKFLVPVASEVVEQQRERLGLDALQYYDLSFSFPSGNPMPKGDKDQLVLSARQMYDEMSPQTRDFFRLLIDRELMDLEQKKGKAPGGYCNFIEDEKVPFIFSNFNGTSGDVGVLTHEFGHALQVYMARDHLMFEQRFPGMESAEIHSMGMEFLTYPWMEKFFGEDTQKYFYDHQTRAITFIPYGVLVDAFQHYVYENPFASSKERKAKWRELEKEFNPWKDYSGNTFLEDGGRWQAQLHIYTDPFYYVDYTLAQIVALQIHLRAQKKDPTLWEDYLKVCEVGGTLPFLSILDVGHFDNPFDETVVEQTVTGLRKSLEHFDHMSL